VALMKWAGSPAAWTVSELELPRVDPAADPSLQRWCAVAGGLGLILSRLGSMERSARFPQTEALYALIRRRLRHSEPVRAGAELLGEVMHEIADSADPLTRACLKACFEASLRQDADAAAPTAPQPLAGSSQVSAEPRPSGRGSQRPDSDAADTSFNTDVLLERSNALRRLLAAARHHQPPEPK
jgi:hypothetical protein